MSATLPGAALLMDGRRDDDRHWPWRTTRWSTAWPQAAGPSTTGPCATTRSPGARLLQVLDDDARRVRAPRRRAQGRRALGAQRPHRPAHAVTFGGYSSELKKALDHVIPILQPFMQKRHGETRHPQRYARRRDLLWSAPCRPGRREGAEAQTFRRLVERNTSTCSRALGGGVLEQGAGDWEVSVGINALLAEVGVQRPRRRPARPGGCRMKAPRRPCCWSAAPSPATARPSRSVRTCSRLCRSAAWRRRSLNVTKACARGVDGRTSRRRRVGRPRRPLVPALRRLPAGAGRPAPSSSSLRARRHGGAPADTTRRPSSQSASPDSPRRAQRM